MHDQCGQRQQKSKVLFEKQYRLQLILFFFNDTATTEIYTLSLHDALPISDLIFSSSHYSRGSSEISDLLRHVPDPHNVDRKSTRLNSSHSQISYAVFCLKKKNSIKCNSSLHTRTSHSVAGTTIPINATIYT